MMAYFEENDEEQLTVHQLVCKMKEFLICESEVWSMVYVKKKVIEHFGGETVSAIIEGKSDIAICNTQEKSFRYSSRVL